MGEKCTKINPRFFSRLPGIHTKHWASTALAELSEMATCTHQGIWTPFTTHSTSEYMPTFCNHDEFKLGINGKNVTNSIYWKNQNHISK